MTDDLLKVTWEQSQNETGLSGRLGSHETKPLAASLTPSWVKDLLFHCKRQNAVITDTLSMLEPCQKHNTCIVNEIMKQKCSEQELTQINECRKFL